MSDPADLLAALRGRGLTLATAESLTAGGISSRIAEVPGASSVLRGGVVCYATAVKAEVLGVDPVLLAVRGAVDADVGRQMAIGARDLLRADLAVAATGVAGPDPQDGTPVGRVHLGLAGPEGFVRSRRLDLVGTRAEIRARTVTAALDFIADSLEELP